MHKLVRLLDSPLVDELMARLGEASIKATHVPERSIAEIDLGTPMSVGVWIADLADLGRAQEILARLRASIPDARCPDCGYDLRGHGGFTMCPECGRAITAPPADVTCPGCGEPVPENFDVCWNCGAHMPA